MTITSQGFQFLLEDRQTQLWQILMIYLARKQRKGEAAADILSLFFSLGCMQLGQDYSASKSFRHLVQGQQCLDDLEQYGFIYRRQVVNGRKSDQFFPTHLATSLCSGDTTVNRTASADDKRFLILETNYRVYAYTSNELEIAILNLFVNITIRYPNLVVGHLDRKHVKAAMDKGISAYQIISYLTTHAHPQMYNHPPPLLHPSVTDQLHLWDRERNRVQAQDSEWLELQLHADETAVSFEFKSKELFEACRDEAERMGALQHSVQRGPGFGKFIFVDPAIRESLRDFIKEKQSQLRGVL